MKILMGLLCSVGAVVLALAVLFACGGGVSTASEGVRHGNSGPTTSSGGARLLFSSGFEGSITLRAPSLYGEGAWQDIVGTDSTTGSTWPGNIWGGGIRSQMIVDAPVNSTTLGNYMVNRIETVTGRDGNPTRVLYSELKQRGSSNTQDVLMLQPAWEEGDMYVSFWLKLQPDLLEKMTPQNWRAVFEWKTGGDYRVIAMIASWEDVCRGKPNGPLYWLIQGDNDANGGLPYRRFWQVDNCSHAVPVDEWFKFEVFWHRNRLSKGRVWMAVNGRVIVDRYEPIMGVNDAPIDRIMIPNLYSGTPYPVYQWVDDVEIWNGFPPVGNNPPYGPH